MLGDQLGWQAGTNFVQVGTAAVYGARHQLGPLKASGASGKSGARPFLGLTTEDRGELVDIFGSYIVGPAQT
jgi:phage gpG-like protein